MGQRRSNLYRVLQAAGGIAPLPRTRSLRVLSFREREKISRRIAAGESFRAIARSLDRAVPTTSQEVGRHGGRGRYRAAEGDDAAWESARRPKPCLLTRNRALQRRVAVKLEQDWSPQQIAGWLREQYPPALRRCGCRRTRSTALFSFKRACALKKARFTVATDVKVHFCDPYSLWQRGSNENTNGLLRQYYLKETDLSAVTQAQSVRLQTPVDSRANSHCCMTRYHAKPSASDEIGVSSCSLP